MIKIVGTSHVSKESIKRIEENLDNIDIIALELDPQRLHALLTKQKTSKNPKIILRTGFLGYAFLLIAGFLQQKVGKITGLTPGSEMLYAFRKAKEKNLKVALIDQDVRVTLQRLSKMKLRHKLKLFREMFRPAPKYMRFDVRKIPQQEFIIKAMNYLKERAPMLHKILIEERNYVMAKRLAILQHRNPSLNILAVIGAGHVKEVELLLKKYLKEISLDKA